MNRNGSGAAPRVRPSSASRTAAGVANITRRRVSDRREDNGDVAHIWPRGVDGIGDHAFAISLAGHGGSDWLGESQRGSRSGAEDRQQGPVLG